MPLVDIHLIEGVFDTNQKQAMIKKVTDTIVQVEGEAMRGVTWSASTRSQAGNGRSAASRLPPAT